MKLFKFSRIVFAFLYCFVLLGMTVGCSDGTSSTDSLGVEVSQDDFDPFKSSGLWSRTIEMSVPFEMDIFEVTAAIDLQIKSKDIASIDARDPNNVLSDNCDEYGFDEIELVDDQSIEEDYPGCDIKPTLKFYKSDDSNYSITMDCDTNRLATMRMNKVSNGHIFEGNSLSFNSESFGDVEASSGVCGMISDIYQSITVTPEPNSLGETSEAKDIFSILVAGPYEGERIVLEFDAEGDLKTGVYSLSETVSEGEVGTMDVEITSFAFGSFGESAVSYTAADGKLTLTALTESKAVGAFDITLYTGARLEGEFSLDL